MDNIRKHIASLEYLKDKILYVACSGGMDSMLLLAITSKYFTNVTALHMNYGLRGKESDEDEAFVREFCQKRGIKFLSKRSNLSTQTDANIQLEARKERYKWFQEILDISPNNRVLLAHHADDQVETFFMNLIRNSGVMGLAAMPEEHDGIVRPLLEFTKEELKNLAVSLGVNWREDSSNKESKYVRNSWRNEYLPFIEKEIPGIREEVVFLISKFQELQNVLEGKVKPLTNSLHEQEFIGDQKYDEMDVFEQVELWRQLGQHASIVEELKRLKQKGKYLYLKENEFGFDLLVREADGYSFIRSKAVEEVPELLIEKVQNIPDEFDLNTLYLDEDRVKGDLILRTWKQGDRIHPVGMKGSKLVSDILSDKKLRFKDKLRTLVLCDDDNVLWLAGLKVGRYALADSKSQNILRISSPISQE